MNFFKNIFGKPENEIITSSTKNKNEISINAINRKSSDLIEIDFIVPSKKLFFIHIETDSFTKEKTIKFKAIASYLSDKLITWGDGSAFIQLCIGMKNINGQDFIVFSTYQKSLKFKKGDKIAFLFQDKEIIEFELLEKGYKVDQDQDGVIIESYSTISNNEIEKFRTVKTDKWRHIPSDNMKPVTGTLTNELQNDILEMTRVYMYVFENNIK